MSLTDSLLVMLTILVCILAKFLCAAYLTTSAGLIDSEQSLPRPPLYPVEEVIPH